MGLAQERYQYRPIRGNEYGPRITEEETVKQVFFRYLTEETEAGRISPEVTLIDFYNNPLFSTIPHNVRIEGFLHWEKERLRDKRLNPINFVAGTLRAGLAGSGNRLLLAPDFTTEQFAAGYGEVIKNLTTFVAEHPKAQAEKRDSISYHWEKVDGDWKMRGDFGYMDDIIKAGLASSQSANFEIPRYLINQHNYEMIKVDRTRSLIDKAYVPKTFVEFSPSPTLTDEAKARGYQGNSCIFIFTFDPETRTEHVEQLWFKASWQDFAPLFTSLDGQEHSNLTDTSVMEVSNFFDERQRTRIYHFVETHDGEVTPHNEIDQYIENELKNYLHRELGETLKLGAEKLRRGESIEEQLDVISSTLRFAQEKLKREIGRMTGLTVSQLRVSDEDWYRAENNAAARMMFVKQNEEKMTFSGCGGGVVIKQDSVYGKNGIWRGSVIFKDKYGNIEDFPCPNEACGRIIHREENKVVTNCPNCGTRLCV